MPNPATDLQRPGQQLPTPVTNQWRWPWEGPPPAPTPSGQAIASAGGVGAAGGAVQRPPVVQLSPQQKQDILRQLRQPGWYVSDVAVPDVKVTTDPSGLYPPSSTDTGELTVVVQDEQGNPQTVTLVRGQAPNADTGAEGTFVVSKQPEGPPKPPSPSANRVGEPGSPGGVWEKGSDGVWKQVVAPTASGADIKNTVDAQQAQNDINRRKANELAGRGYLTDKEWIDFQQEAARMGMTAQQVDTARKKYELEKRDADAKLQPTIDQILATTGRTKAETGQITSQQQIAEQKAGPEIAEIEQRTAASKLAGQIAGAPQLVAPQTGMYTYQTNPLTGQVSTQYNVGFQPKTLADVAARSAQLQSMAQAKQAELQARLDNKEITPEQASQQWTAWWDANIESQKPGLQAAQEQAQYERTKDAQEAQRAAMQTAQAAGTQAISAYNAQAPRRVGPGFAELVGKTQPGYRPSAQEFQNAFVVQAPDLNQYAQQRTMEALKGISPGAAAATGGPPPNYAGFDYTAGLNRTNYGFGGAAQGAVPAAPPMAAPVLPSGPAQAPQMPAWLRGDQMFGGAPAGNAMIPPGGQPAGWVDPNSPAYMGNYFYPG
jgi:hypothetical protein